MASLRPGTGFLGPKSTATPKSVSARHLHANSNDTSSNVPTLSTRLGPLLIPGSWTRAQLQKGGGASEARTLLDSDLHHSPRSFLSSVNKLPLSNSRPRKLHTPSSTVSFSAIPPFLSLTVHGFLGFPDPPADVPARRRPEIFWTSAGGGVSGNPRNPWTVRKRQEGGM